MMDQSQGYGLCDSWQQRRGGVGGQRGGHVKCPSTIFVGSRATNILEASLDLQLPDETDPKAIRPGRGKSDHIVSEMVTRTLQKASQLTASSWSPRGNTGSTSTELTMCRTCRTASRLIHRRKEEYSMSLSGVPNQWLNATN